MSQIHQQHIFTTYPMDIGTYVYGGTCPNVIEPLCANTLGYVNVKFVTWVKHVVACPK